MPWKLILFLLALIVLTCFFGFNVTNVCNISFGFYTFEKIPVFMSTLIAFTIGVLVMLPFTFGKRKKTEKKPSETTTTKPTVQAAPIAQGSKPVAYTDSPNETNKSDKSE